MDVKKAPRHIAVGFLLHPNSIDSLLQLGTCSAKEKEEFIPSEHKGPSHTPPPSPRILISPVHNNSNVPEWIAKWGGIAKSSEYGAFIIEPNERVLIDLINTIKEVTGLSPTAFHLIRGGPLFTLEDSYFGADDYSTQPIKTKSMKLSKMKSPRTRRLLQDSVPDPFRLDGVPPAQTKPDIVIHAYLFQVTDASQMRLKEFHWVTPAELELQNDELKGLNVAPGMSRSLASVYLPPLWNTLIQLLKDDKYRGATETTTEAVDLLSIILEDSWHAFTGDSDDPAAPPPPNLDELCLGAPYLSQLCARTALHHLEAVLYHLIVLRPTMSTFATMVRYLNVSLKIAARFLTQMQIMNDLSSIAESEVIADEIPPLIKKPSLLQRFRLRPFWLEEAATQSDHFVNNSRMKALEPVDGDDEVFLPASERTPQALYTKTMARMVLAVMRYKLFMRVANQECVNKASQFVLKRKSILVYGRSSLVEQALLDFQGDIFVPEGRPYFTGVKFANKLLELDKTMRVHVIADFQVGIFIHHVDAVFVGTDTILPDGGFVNTNHTEFDQAGTYLLALAAANARVSSGVLRPVPFFVIATTAKIMTLETLEMLSKAQSTDGIVLIPPQHPKGLYLESEDENRPVFDSASSLHKDAPCWILDRHEIKSQAICNELNVATHLIDPKAPFGAILETRPQSELSEIWKNLNTEFVMQHAMLDNVVSETIPSYLVSGYITEHGLVCPQEVNERSKEYISHVDRYIRDTFK